MYKIMVTVPLSHADAVRKAMGDAGAGAYPGYSHCSFSVRGVGRFLPLAGAQPFIGAVGGLETVDEEQIQVTVADDKLHDVLKAMRDSHPYEEIAFDVYRLEEILLRDLG